jgi:hypothetical protein
MDYSRRRPVTFADTADSCDRLDLAGCATRLLAPVAANLMLPELSPNHGPRGRSRLRTAGVAQRTKLAPSGERPDGDSRQALRQVAVSAAPPVSPVFCSPTSDIAAPPRPGRAGPDGRNEAQTAMQIWQFYRRVLANRDSHFFTRGIGRAYCFIYRHMYSKVR